MGSLISPSVRTRDAGTLSVARGSSGAKPRPVSLLGILALGRHSNRPTTAQRKNLMATQTQDEAKFYQLESYPWDSDAEFQSGLQAILGSDPSPEQAEHLTLRARCFYFSRYIASKHT